MANLMDDRLSRDMELLSHIPYNDKRRPELHERVVTEGCLGDMAVHIRSGRVNDSKITTAAFRASDSTIRLDSWKEPSFYCELAVEDLIKEHLPAVIEELSDQVEEERCKRQKIEKAYNDLILEVALLKKSREVDASVDHEVQAPSAD